MLIELISQTTGGPVVIDARQITTVTKMELGCRVNIGPFYSIDVKEQPEYIRGLWQAALLRERAAHFAVELVSTEWCRGVCGSKATVDKVWKLAIELADAEPSSNP
jgi:hypothetical protein